MGIVVAIMATKNQHILGFAGLIEFFQKKFVFCEFLKFLEAQYLSASAC